MHVGATACRALIYTRPEVCARATGRSTRRAQTRRGAVGAYYAGGLKRSSASGAVALKTFDSAYAVTGFSPAVSSADCPAAPWQRAEEKTQIPHSGLLGQLGWRSNQ